jgi:GTP-binding protein
MVSFLREKFIPSGGPDGGDGGSGGDMVLIASSSVADLSLVRRKKEFAAKPGDSGGKWKKHGKKGEDSAILVPVGTMVFIRDESGEKRLIADLITLGQKVLVAKGGSGGLGNAHFATAVNQAPEVASEGKLGEEKHIILELKLITDMCIVGSPNSGKSTLLSALSAAKAEVADYPFTTRQPVLGVMRSSRGEFIMAEIPAIVGGAHIGKGLGYEFLRHAERTKLLIYLLDGSSPSIVEEFNKLDNELALYSTDLWQKPKIVAVNKIDLPQVQARLPHIEQSLSFLNVPMLFISALGGRGVTELASKAADLVQQESQYNRDTTLQAQMAVFHPKAKRRSR